MSSKWLTFDCYGTLIDWCAGMLNALEPAVGADAYPLRDAYYRAELTVEAGEEFQSYKEVLREGLRRAAVATGIDLPEGADNAFVAGWSAMPVFDDVEEALAAVRADGWKLGVITNCDEDLFAATLPQLPATFDHFVTAERIRSYRPQLNHFRTFAAEADIDPARWIHVGTSWINDVLPAARMGIASIWTDRELTGHPPELATVRLADLRQLPQAVEAISTTPALTAAVHARQVVTR
jgi:2-haloacid dehalogenase